MTKQDIIRAVARQTGATQETTEAIINATLYTITNALIDGETVKLYRFGTFSSKQRRGGVGNINGRRIEYSPRTAITFKPSDNMKGAVNEWRRK